MNDGTRFNLDGSRVSLPPEAHPIDCYEKDESLFAHHPFRLAQITDDASDESFQFQYYLRRRENCCGLRCLSGSNYRGSHLCLENYNLEQ